MSTGDRIQLDLLVPTIGRTVELDRYLSSLDAQAGVSLRVILIDQNEDDRLAAIASTHSARLQILRVRSARGLSRARNVGIREATAPLLGLADDDCWYPPGVIGRVVDTFLERPEVDCLCGRVVEPTPSAAAGRWDARGGRVNRFNVWKRAMSTALFVRREVVEAVGGFDEALGLGAGTPFGSGEETEFLLRAMELGFVVVYDPSITVHHESGRRFTAEDWSMARSYGRGLGRVMRMHEPWWFALYYCLRALAGAALAVAGGRLSEAGFHLSVFLGRVTGLLSR